MVCTIILIIVVSNDNYPAAPSSQLSSADDEEQEAASLSQFLATCRGDRYKSTQEAETGDTTASRGGTRDGKHQILIKLIVANSYG